MGFLFKKSQTIPSLTGLQVSTSVNVLPIAIIYGSPRVSLNLVETNGFNKVKMKTGGGKGLLGGGKSGTSGYDYFANLWMAMGEGEISEVLYVFLDQAVYLFANLPGDRPMSVVPGSATQTPIGAASLAYRHTAGLWCPNFHLDSSATVPQINVVPKGVLAGTCPLINDAFGGFEDADPAQVIQDFLTNQFYGVLFPAALLDSNIISSADAFNPLIGDGRYQTYCQAVGFGFSVVLSNVEPASSILDRWLKLTNSAAVWNGVSLQIIPYGDMPQSANPLWDASNPGSIGLKYYAPNQQPLFDFTDCEVLQTSDNSDPVTIDRKDQADAYNVIRLDYRERGLEYNDVPLEAPDDNATELYGKRVESMNAANEFTSSVFASNSAQLILQRSVHLRNTYTWRTTWEWAFLDPMDLVTITDPVLGTQIIVRIISIEEDDKEELTLTAEQLIIGMATATLYPKQTPLFPPIPNPGILAPCSNVPLIYEPTSSLLAAIGASGPTLGAALSGGPAGVFNPNWGGANIYVSLDNVTYSLIGPFTGVSTQGQLTAALPSYAGSPPDITNTLSVYLGESDGALQTVTDMEAMMGLSLLIICDPDYSNCEYVGYVTATLTGSFAYDLTRLYRGMFGTAATTHGLGSLVALSSGTFTTPLPNQYVGHVLYVKIQSFNIFNQGFTDLADCGFYTYTPTGVGAPTNFIITDTVSDDALATETGDRLVWTL